MSSLRFCEYCDSVIPSSYGYCPKCKKYPKSFRLVEQKTVKLANIELNEKFKKKLERQAKEIMNTFAANKTFEILCPITEDGIVTTIISGGSKAHVDLIDGEVDGKEIIGYFHTHPKGSVEGFSRTDIKTGLHKNYDVIMYGDLGSGNVKTLFKEEFVEALDLVPKHRRRFRRLRGYDYV